MDMDIFQLFFNNLEERPYNNIYQNINQYANYLENTMQEHKSTTNAKNLIYGMNSG